MKHLMRFHAQMLLHIIFNDKSLSSMCIQAYIEINHSIGNCTYHFIVAVTAEKMILFVSDGACALQAEIK